MAHTLTCAQLEVITVLTHIRQVIKVMKKFLMSSTISSDDKTVKVKNKPSGFLAGKIMNVQDEKKSNVATNRAYRAYMQV